MSLLFSPSVFSVLLLFYLSFKKDKQLCVEVNFNLLFLINCSGISFIFCNRSISKYHLEMSKKKVTTVWKKFRIGIFLKTGVYSQYEIVREKDVAH